MSMTKPALSTERVFFFISAYIIAETFGTFGTNFDFNIDFSVFVI